MHWLARPPAGRVNWPARPQDANKGLPSQQHPHGAELALAAVSTPPQHCGALLGAGGAQGASQPSPIAAGRRGTASCSPATLQASPLAHDTSLLCWWCKLNCDAMTPLPTLPGWGAMVLGNFLRAAALCAACSASSHLRREWCIAKILGWL